MICPICNSSYRRFPLFKSFECTSCNSKLVVKRFLAIFMLLVLLIFFATIIVLIYTFLTFDLDELRFNEWGALVIAGIIANSGGISSITMIVAWSKFKAVEKIKD